MALLWKIGELSFCGDVDLLAREYFGCSVCTFPFNSCGAYGYIYIVVHRVIGDSRTLMLDMIS